MQRVRWLSALAFAVCTFMGTAHAATAPKPLILGIFPYLNSHLVVSKFAPLRDYLAQQLGRPVQIYTAPDFRTFIARTQRGEYDIALTAPHLARMAITEAGYVPLATYQAELTGLLVVSAASTFSQLAELRGKTIAIPDKLAIVTMMGKQLLRDAGLQPDQDYKLMVTHSHSSAALSLSNGQADAAIIGSNPYKQLSKEQRDQLRILATTPAIPTQYYIARQRLGSVQLERLRTLLLQFAAETPQGRKFVEENNVGGIRATDGKELASLDRFARETKRLVERPE